MITLELLNETHINHLARVANNPQVSSTSGVPYPCPDHIVEGWVKENKAITPQELHFAIIFESKAIGCCILKKIDWNSRVAELSYWIGTEYWSKGITSTAARIMRDFAFDIYRFERLESHYLKSTNKISGKILHKLGFIPDVRRSDIGVEGRFLHLAPDVWTFFALTRDAWLNLKDLRSWKISSMDS